MTDGNSYYNEPIDFYIEKPKGWAFLPTQWAMNVRKKTAYSNEDIAVLMEQASIPFVYMQKPLNRDDIAFPTAQATCRYFESPTPEKMEQLARLQVQTFEGGFRDFDLIDMSPAAELSGCPATYFKGSFSIKNESGQVFQCQAQSWTVFYNNLAYTIGVSGSSENLGEYGSDSDDILRSILIGRAT